MAKYECSNCGAEARTEIGDYVFRESGLRNVVLHNIEIVHCPKCDNEDPIIPAMGSLMRTLALAVIRKPYRLRGDEVRFLRGYLGLSGGDFARLVHVDRATLSKWEHGEDPVGGQSDLLIRSVAMALGEGLQEGQADIVKRFSSIKGSSKIQRIDIDVKTMELCA